MSVVTSIHESLHWRHLNTPGRHNIFVGPGYVCAIQINGGKMGLIMLCSHKAGHSEECSVIAMIEKPVEGQRYEYHAYCPFGACITMDEPTDLTVAFSHQGGPHEEQHPGG